MTEAKSRIICSVTTTPKPKEGDYAVIYSRLEYWNSLNQMWWNEFEVKEECRIVFEKSYDGQTWKIIHTAVIPANSRPEAEYTYTFTKEDAGKTVYFMTEYYGCNTISDPGQVEDGFHLPPAMSNVETVTVEAPGIIDRIGLTNLLLIGGFVTLALIAGFLFLKKD